MGAALIIAGIIGRSRFGRLGYVKSAMLLKHSRGKAGLGVGVTSYARLVSLESTELLRRHTDGETLNT